MIIMVTGSRNWSLSRPIEKHLYWFTRGVSEVTLLEGGAEGADRIARAYALSRGWEVVTFLPKYEQYGTRAPHVRNQLMVDEKPDIVLAYIRGMSSGAVTTVMKAYMSKIMVRPYYYEDYE